MGEGPGQVLSNTPHVAQRAPRRLLARSQKPSNQQGFRAVGDGNLSADDVAGVLEEHTQAVTVLVVTPVEVSSRASWHVVTKGILWQQKLSQYKKILMKGVLVS